MSENSGITSDKSKKKHKKLESVTLAEYMVLKEKHETLIQTLELLEDKYGFTLNDLENKEKEILVAKEEIEKWEKKFGELEKKLEKVEEYMEDLRSLEVENRNSSVSCDELMDISDVE